MCRYLMEKLEQTINQTKGNKEQNDGQTDNHYIQQLTKN